ESDPRRGCRAQGRLSGGRCGVLCRERGSGGAPPGWPAPLVPSRPGMDRAEVDRSPRMELPNETPRRRRNPPPGSGRLRAEPLVRDPIDPDFAAGQPAADAVDPRGDQPGKPEGRSRLAPRWAPGGGERPAADPRPFE